MFDFLLLCVLLVHGSLAQRASFLLNKPQVSTCKWSNWIDRDNPSGAGDYEYVNKNTCKYGVEKYEVTLVAGGSVYDDVNDVPSNVMTYHPTLNPPQIACKNGIQPGCITSSNGYKVGPSPPCCLDYKARFCCKPRPQVATCKWTNWIDRDDSSGKGDYEFDENHKKTCRNGVEKYEVTLVTGGSVYDNVNDVPSNVMIYNPASSEGPQVACVNVLQPRCKTNSNGWKAGPSPPCCLDYKARFCCKIRKYLAAVGKLPVSFDGK
eukprot:GFUD01008976.1.p1 GENE.GFUD01008976.1~~GFUD01008976.1.p1  ORF type:complete len:264 (+),score=51.53 GFUD01008976.1:44-835(+)